MEGLATLLETVGNDKVLDAAIADVDRRRDAEEVREKLGELASVAWLSTVSVLREKYDYDRASVGEPTRSRFNHHLELMNIYMRSAGEDIYSLNADELLLKFSALLEARQKTLPESVRSFILFYEILLSQLKIYLRSTLLPDTIMFLFYVNVADICFKMLSVLEATAYQPPRPS